MAFHESIRVSMLNMLKRLSVELGVGFLFITHDLAIAKYFAWSGHIAVMYLGRIVEYGPTPVVINAPQHPYTRALLSAIPEPDPISPASATDSSCAASTSPACCTCRPAAASTRAARSSRQGLCDTLRPELARNRSPPRRGLPRRRAPARPTLTVAT